MTARARLLVGLALGLGSGPVAADAPAPTPPAPAPAEARDPDVETIDLATALALAEAEMIVIWDERPDKPFDRDTTPRLERAELARRGVTDVAAALALVPDVTVREAGRGGRQIDVRGARRSAVKLLIDGVAVDDPFYGNFDLASLPATDLAQLRVATTPASPIDGAGGPGGVIELHTTDAIGAAELVARANAATAPGGGVAVTGRHAMTDTWAVRASAAGELGATTFALPGMTSVDEDRQSASAALRLEHRAGRRRVVVDGFGLVRGYVVPPADEGTVDLTRIDREVTGRASGQLDLTRGRWQLLANAYAHGTTRATSFFRDPTLTTPTAEEDLRANRAGFGAIATRGLGPRTRAIAALHLDTEAARVEDLSGVTRGRSTVAEVAAGGQLETARVRLDGALGLAVPIAVDGPVRPEGKLTARFALDRHASVTATVARKGRLPTLRERYRAAPGAELTDEQNDFVEVKVELGGAGLEVASAAWVRASDGLIKNDPATQTFTNTGALTLAGLDATATWGKGGRLEGGLAYSFVEAQDDTADEPLDFLARHRGHVYLATRPLRPLWTEVRLRVLGRRLDRGQWLPAHASLDLSASATWGGWLVTGQLTDALDARYDVRYRVPSAGRTVAATVTRRW